MGHIFLGDGVGFVFTGGGVACSCIEVGQTIKYLVL